MDVFDRYAPFVQDFIYEHGWEQLRGVQVAAAEAIFETDENVLLTASTASGKTEAAFFPILTEFWEDPPATVGAIYIGPLKALINDQFLRLDALCAQAGINVWRWHGDVSASHKNRLIKNPSGILQITPESLEALLLHKHSAIASLFGDLRYVVIDEVHSLLRADRGGQCLACIERLSRLAGVNPRRIGLSATIGDPETTGDYLSSRIWSFVPSWPASRRKRRPDGGSRRKAPEAAGEAALGRREGKRGRGLQGRRRQSPAPLQGKAPRRRARPRSACRVSSRGDDAFRP